MDTYQSQYYPHLLQQRYNNPQHPPEKPLLRAASVPYHSSSSSGYGAGEDKLQDYMKGLSSGRGEFVTGGSKPPLKPTVSVAPSTSTGRRDEMVAGNSYVYQRVRKRSIPLKQHASTSTGSSDHHTSRAPHSDKERMHRRSVSPQMHKRPVLSPPSSLPSIETEQKPSSSKPTFSCHKNPRKKIDMKLVDNRMNSFTRPPNWELHSVSYHPIASAGFYFTGQEDIVKCSECELEHCDWSPHDDPLELHFDKSPNCLFLRRENPVGVADLCSNKFYKYRSVDERLRSFSMYPGIVDIRAIANSGFFYADGKTQCYACGFVKDGWTNEEDPIAVHRNFYSECLHLKKMETKSENQIPSQVPSSNEAMPLKKPDYSSVSVRLQSFKHYSSHAVDKEDLVEAGFYLLSQPETVKCFACDLVINKWYPGDNPLKKHYRFNPSCPFLQGKDVSSPLSIPPDQSSFPAPMYTYQEMVDKFKGVSVVSGNSSGTGSPAPERQEEALKDSNEKIKVSTGKERELFNLPVHLPPKYKGRDATMSTPAYYSYQSVNSPTTPDETFHSLTEDDKICIICFEKPKEYAIIPCGHLCTCADCSERLKNCPVCRRPKKSVIRIFNT